MSNKSPKIFTLEQRASMSASHRYKRGTTEWIATYNSFILNNGSIQKDTKVHRSRKIEWNAAIFASHRAPGLKNTPVWRALLRNYIERVILIDEARRELRQLHGEDISKLLYCPKCQKYLPYEDFIVVDYDKFKTFTGFCTICGEEMMPGRL